MYRSVILRQFAAASLLVAGASLVGCAAAPSEEGPAALNQHIVGDGDGDGTATAKPRVVTVRANGTGCREGQWESQISEDGTSVTLKLDHHFAHVGRGEAFSINDCTISLDVEDAAGHAFTLDAAEADGFAHLSGAEVNARRSLKYYFMGDPTAAESREQVFTSDGPGAPYAWSAGVGGEEAIWSRCGGGRALNVQTRLVLQNNADKSGWGYVGAQTMRLRLKSRPCS